MSEVMPTKEDVLKAFNLGFSEGNAPYQKARVVMEEQEKEIRYLRNKCKAERRKERGK